VCLEMVSVGCQSKVGGVNMVGLENDEYRYTS